MISRYCNLKCLIHDFHGNRCCIPGILPGTESGKIFLRKFPATQQTNRLNLNIFSALNVLRNRRRKFFKKDFVNQQIVLSCEKMV